MSDEKWRSGLSKRERKRKKEKGGRGGSRRGLGRRAATRKKSKGSQPVCRRNLVSSFEPRSIVPPLRSDTSDTALLPVVSKK